MKYIQTLIKDTLLGLSLIYTYEIEYIPKVVIIKRQENVWCIIPFRLIRTLTLEHDRDKVIKLLRIAIKNMKEPGRLNSITSGKDTKE